MYAMLCPTLLRSTMPLFCPSLLSLRFPCLRSLFPLPIPPPPRPLSLVLLPARSPIVLVVGRLSEPVPVPVPVPIAMFLLSLPLLALLARPLPQAPASSSTIVIPPRRPPLRAPPPCSFRSPPDSPPSQWTAPSRPAMRKHRCYVGQAQLVQQNMWCKKVAKWVPGWHFHAQVDQPAAWEQGLNSGM